MGGGILTPRRGLPSSGLLFPVNRANGQVVGG